MTKGQVYCDDKKTVNLKKMYYLQVVDYFTLFNIYIPKGHGVPVGFPIGSMPRSE